MVTERRRTQASWFALTLPLAPLCAVVYAACEWLFIVTKPSALASLPLNTELAVLVRGPLPALLPLVAVQAGASLLSLVAFPRLRALAVVPGALVAGALALVMVDNFTYTLFGVGVLTTDGLARVLYAAFVPALVVIAGDRLFRWTASASRQPRMIFVSAALSAIVAAAPVLLTPEHFEPDTAAPPALGGAGVASRPNILILGIDGVDAASLSAYGYERDTSPYLAALRDESLFFENAFPNVGRTHGSLVSLLAGRLPFSTYVTFPPTALRGADAHRHLPGLLKPQGYTSLQLGMRHYADAEDANLLGFDAANYRWQDLAHLDRRSDNDEADLFRREVVERLDERLGHLFGLRHAIDIHAHVEGKQESPFWKDDRRVETLTRYLPTAPEPWFVHTHFLDTHCCAYRPAAMVFSGTDRTTDARDSQLREADDKVRTVIESLRTSGRLEHTVVVITSDHTNGWTTKGRVPLLIRFPGRLLAGRVQENVQLADVAPTLMDYLDEPIPSWMDGVSLIDEGQRRRPRPIFGVSEIAGRHAVGPLVKALDDAGAPNYGAGSATLVAGSRWFELSLADGTLASGEVAGHTAPSLPTVDEATARTLLEGRLAASGFRIGSAASGPRSAAIR
ncbi:MAG TPA: sulfatase-like hydrolase/transferase [Vicinamibacterales bacterium]|nr:sulfatase-like hydrolase/transferase [Vicinamibacterales bacterium]